MLRKIVTWAVVLFAVFYIATDPVHAGAFVHVVFGDLRSAAASMSKFVNSL